MYAVNVSMLCTTFQSVKNPKSVYRHLQSLLGKKHENLQVALYQKRFPEHHLQEDPVRGTVHFKNSEWASLCATLFLFIHYTFTHIHITKSVYTRNRCKVNTKSVLLCATRVASQLWHWFLDLWNFTGQCHSSRNYYPILCFVVENSA